MLNADLQERRPLSMVQQSVICNSRCRSQVACREALLMACLPVAGSSNQQLGATNATLQGQLGSHEAYVELCVQELRRLSALANEPFQLPAIPAPAQARSHLQAPTLAHACELHSTLPKCAVCRRADAKRLPQLSDREVRPAC